MPKWSWVRKVVIAGLPIVGWLGNGVYSKYKGMDEQLQAHALTFISMKYDISDLRKEINRTQQIATEDREVLGRKIDRVEDKLDRWFTGHK